MIRDGAPAEWTPLMRDVAKEIADSARDPSPDDPPLPDGQWPWSPLHVEGYRDRWGTWHDGLAEICGATPRAVSDALTRLARWGYEMRQPVTDREGKPVTDKRGRVVYAASGHAVSFWVPPLVPRPEPGSSHQDASNAGESSHHDATKNSGCSHQDATIGPERSHHNATPSPQCFSPQENQSPQPPVPAASGSGEAQPAAAGDDEEEMTRMIIREMKGLTGATIGAGTAGRIGRELLGRRDTPPEHPVAWVRAVLRAEPSPRRFLPTPVPPAFTAARRPPADGAAALPEHPNVVPVIGAEHRNLTTGTPGPDGSDRSPDPAAFGQCGYGQCRISTPVPPGSDMHESCGQFARVKAQAQTARLAAAAGAEQDCPKASLPARGTGGAGRTDRKGGTGK